MLIAGLVLTLVGTIFSVQARSKDWKLSIKLQSKDDEKPVTLLSTKFKVPATNTFDEFWTGITNFKVDQNEKSRIKFAKPSD